MGSLHTDTIRRESQEAPVWDCPFERGSSSITAARPGWITPRGKEVLLLLRRPYKESTLAERSRSQLLFLLLKHHFSLHHRLTDIQTTVFPQLEQHQVRPLAGRDLAAIV